MKNNIKFSLEGLAEKLLKKLTVEGIKTDAGFILIATAIYFLALVIEEGFKNISEKNHEV